MTPSQRAVEAAARAIYESLPHNKPYSLLTKFNRDRITSQARAALTAALAVDGVALVHQSALDQMRHTERKFELIVKYMVDLAGGLPVEPASIDGATYIFKDPSPERTLRALQAAVKRAIELAKDMSDKRIDALLTAASDREERK